MSTDSTGPALPRPPTDLLAGSSLFLDFDGTLVELIDDPAEVAVNTGLRALLAKLQQRLDGRLAVLTGRAADEIRSLLEPLDLVVGGSHGLELPCGSPAERVGALDGLIEGLRGLSAEHPGVIVEDKPFGVALHFRQAPGAEEACRQAAEETSRLTGLEIQPGKMVFELKPSDGNKGAALRQLMQQPPFAGAVPIFLGDDLTDEPAFDAARRLGGAGILVGEHRRTEAIFRLANVADALAWLETSAEACA